MDRKIKRNEYSDKKIDYKVKDSGDSKKSYIFEGLMKAIYLERGDSGERKITATNKKSEQMRLNIYRTKTTNEGPKSKYTAEKDMPRKNDHKNVVGQSNAEIRKRIRDKYTFKYNVPVNKSDHLSLFTSNKRGKVVSNSDGNDSPITIRMPTDPEKIPTKPLPEETSRINEKQIRPSSGQSDVDKKPDSIPENKSDKRSRWRINSPKKRRPIIKTVVSKTNTAKIFKAVTFVDNINSTPLEIKIPGENIIIKKQQNVSKYTETTPFKLKSKPNLLLARTLKSKLSKETIKMEEKPAIVRKRPAERSRARRFRMSSPGFETLEPACPLTEVARWVPASVDPQTKPYYDAWVDTTLTATRKHTKKDKSLYEYQLRLLKSFKRAMNERHQSPELFYDKFADERYAGRIKITQTERRGRT